MLVWFHRGAFSGGTSNEIETDGARLSRRGDVVVVTVNHRLNAFGYLYLAEFGGAELADSGNVGMLDLILALQWVRDNIAEFGGDAGNVTIFGQSGGGAKCATLMAMPAANGLFHRVLTQSGQQITASRVDDRDASRAAAARRARRCRRIASIELRTLPMEQLVKVSRAPAYLGPVKDGRSLPRDPFDPDAPPQSADIPMILGNTHGETRTLIGRGDPSIFSLTWETLPAEARSRLAVHGHARSRRGDRALPRRGIPSTRRPTCSLPRRPTSRSWRGQVIEAERRAAQPAGAAHTWVFQFDWPTPIDGGKWGAHHGLDVPFIFDNAPLAPQMVGTGADAQALADQMSDDVDGVRAHRPARHAGPAGVAGLRPHAARDDGVRSRRPAWSTIRAAASAACSDQVPYVQPGT